MSCIVYLVLLLCQLVNLAHSIPQETERLMADSPPGISAAPKDDNLRHFDVTVAGPDSSPYEGEFYRRLQLHFVVRTMR